MGTPERDRCKIQATRQRVKHLPGPQPHHGASHAEGYKKSTRGAKQAPCRPLKEVIDQDDIEALLHTDLAMIAENGTHIVLTVRIARATIAKNHHALNVLSDSAADIEPVRARSKVKPPGSHLGEKLLNSDIGYMTANETHVVLSFWLSRKKIARNHGFLTILSDIAPGATPAPFTAAAA